jgi:PAS domain S-box-containing protein
MLGQLFESTADVLWMFSADWTEVLFINGAYEDLWGRESAALERDPTDFLEGIHPDDRDEVHAAMERVAGGRSAEMEFRVDPTGDYSRWVWTRARPIRDEAGDVVHIAGVSRDVTERSEYERELRRQNERLDEFASVVSHDLRNPLSVARGRVSLALEDCDCDEHLVPIASAVERMASIVEDTLTLARQGRAVDEFEWVDVASLAEESWAMIDTADADLEVREAFRVRGDRDRLRHAFENLFANAVEHGSTSPPSQAREDAVEHGSTDSRTRSDDAVENGGTDVTVGVETVGDTGFYVEDDGPGIPPSDRELVLDPGYTSTEGGTGFGLAIVRRVAEAHGWTVEITEGTAGGARFEFHGVDIESVD